MKANRLLGAAMAIGFGLAAMSSASVADAQAGKGAGKKPAAAAPAPAAIPTTKKPIVLIPKGIAWGLNHKQVAGVVDNIINETYKARLAKVSQGSLQQKNMEAAREEEKAAFRRSRIDFGNLPTGLDSTPLKGEYTYNNKESMMVLTRDGTTTRFFFIQDRLWKIIENRTLGEGSASGKDWKDALEKLTKAFEAPGRTIPADYAKGRPSLEVDWKDSATHLRLIQRSDTEIAIALEDNATLGNIETLRSNKPAEDSGIDPSVASVTRKADEPAPPPEKNPKTTKKAPAPAKKQ